MLTIQKFPGFVFPLVIRQEKNVFCYFTSSFQVPTEAENKNSNAEYIFFSFKKLIPWSEYSLGSLLLKKMFQTKKSYSTRSFFSRHIFLLPLRWAILTVPTWARVGYHRKSLGLKTNYKKQILSNCPPQRPHFQGSQVAYLQTETVQRLLTLSYPPIHRLF